MKTLFTKLILVGLLISNGAFGIAVVQCPVPEVLPNPQPVFQIDELATRDAELEDIDEEEVSAAPAATTPAPAPSDDRIQLRR